MFIAGFPAGPWGTNCYVVATGPGSECVVVDPGKDAAQGVAEVVREHWLKPVSVLVTHGHVDHMWCVAPVAGSYDATAWIHPADRHLLTDPMAGMSRETTQMLLGGSYEWAEPDDVRELSDSQVIEDPLPDFELADVPFDLPTILPPGAVAHLLLSASIASLSLDVDLDLDVVAGGEAACGFEPYCSGNANSTGWGAGLLALGSAAVASEPHIEQVFVANKPGLESDSFEFELLRLRKSGADNDDRYHS